MGFGENLKKLLSEKGMTIKGLSEITGIPLNTLYSITKRDSKSVRIYTVKRIANALGVPMDKLLGITDAATLETITAFNPDAPVIDDGEQVSIPFIGGQQQKPTPKPDSDTRLTIDTDDFTNIGNGMESGDKDAESAYLTIQKMLGRIETTKEERQATIDYIRRAREQKAGDDNAPQE